jgi:hypothetical protein
MCFVNASVVNEEYRLVHEPQVIEIDVSSEQAAPIPCMR